MSRLVQVKTEHDKHYGTIALRVLEDSRLSWKAKALHTYLITRPPGWTVNNADLINRATDGRDSIEGAKQELVKHQYLRIEQNRDERHRITGTTWIIAEMPMGEAENTENTPEPGFPYPAFPATAFPDTENPHLNNKHSSNKQGSKKQSKTKPAKSGGDSKTVSPASREVVNALSDALKRHGAREGQFSTSWFFAGCSTASKLLNNGFTVEELKQAVNYLVEHSFYGKNMRSMKDIERNLTVWQRETQASPDNPSNKPLKAEATVEDLIAEMDKIAEGAI